MLSSADADDPDLPRPFGGYMLLALLGQGGMGEVFLAAKGGVEGISRRCVVKTLRPGFSDDREYVARFLDEARVVAQLHHRNICPVFEVGEVATQHEGRSTPSRQYFLAMEYIAGRDLKTVCDRAVNAGSPLPPPLALHIVAEVLEALDYAHALDDAATGEPLLLVHRDISPHNVMIGFDGDVRLIDFGLAASTLKVEQTAPNVVMGKVAYMAPEHICGDVIDARADQFAVAVMATELILGVRFYEGRSTRELYRLAAPGGFRPAGFPSLPEGLRQILDRALAGSADDRFKSCGAFRAALDGWRFAQPGRADTAALKDLMRLTFEGDIAEEQALVSRAAVRAQSSPWSSLSSSPSLPSLTSQSAAPDDATARELSDPTRREARAKREETRHTASAPSASASISTALAPPSAPPSRGPLLVAAGLALIVVVVAIAFFSQTTTPPAPPVAAHAVVVPEPTPPPTPPPTIAPPTIAPPTIAPPTIAPPTIAPPTIAPPSPPPPPTTTTKPKPKPKPEDPPETPRPPSPKPPSATAPPGVRLRWVLEQCAALPCSRVLKANERNWAGLETDAQATFQRNLRDCFARCVAEHR